MFNIEAAQRTLLDEGFIDLKDTTVGDTVLEIERRDFQYLTPFGITYYKQHILNDERIQAVVKSSLGKCKLGHWLRYNAAPGHIESFRSGGKQAGLRVLVVQQFCKDSEVKIWHGSHLHDLPTTDGIRSLYETDQHELEKAGCTAGFKKFQTGGLLIRDARTYAEITKGYAVTFVFAVADALAGWPMIIIANHPEIIRLAEDTVSPEIGLNYAIDD